ncbi:MAG: hypothetical protein ACYDCC_06725 [Actinomycetota bacterium]
MSDSSIDFTGHAEISEFDGCFFGAYCLSIGGIYGDGLLLFDNTTGQSVPTLP